MPVITETHCNPVEQTNCTSLKSFYRVQSLHLTITSQLVHKCLLFIKLSLLKVFTEWAHLSNHEWMSSQSIESLIFYLSYVYTWISFERNYTKELPPAIWVPVETILKRLALSIYCLSMFGPSTTTAKSSLLEIVSISFVTDESWKKPVLIALSYPADFHSIESLVYLLNRIYHFESISSLLLLTNEILTESWLFTWCPLLLWPLHYFAWCL
jgi:hypothetical protein